MVYFSTYEEFESFLEELDYLRNNTKLNPLSAAKISHLRGRTRNQREVDMIEYKYRFKVWQKQFEKEWQTTDWKDREKESLYDFAKGLLIQQVAEAKGKSKSR